MLSTPFIYRIHSRDYFRSSSDKPNNAYPDKFLAFTVLPYTVYLFPTFPFREYPLTELTFIFTFFITPLFIPPNLPILFPQPLILLLQKFHS